AHSNRKVWSGADEGHGGKGDRMPYFVIAGEAGFDVLSHDAPWVETLSMRRAFRDDAPLQTDLVAIRILEIKLLHSIGCNCRWVDDYSLLAEVRVGTVHVSASKKECYVLVCRDARGTRCRWAAVALVCCVEHDINSVQPEQAPVEIVASARWRRGYHLESEDVSIEGYRCGHIKDLKKRCESFNPDAHLKVLHRQSRHFAGLPTHGTPTNTTIPFRQPND